MTTLTPPQLDPEPTDTTGDYPRPSRMRRVFLTLARGDEHRANVLIYKLSLLVMVAITITAVVITYLSGSHIEAAIIGAIVIAGLAYMTIAGPLSRAFGPHWQRFTKTRIGRIVAKILAPVFYLAYKLKALFLLAAKIKYFATLATMVVSIGAYTLIWGWSFAVGFVILLFIHEMGHVIAARREGISASAPMFIPFLGAAIMMREMPKNAVAEARVGLAGPIAGGLGCLLPILGYHLFGGSEWLALAYTGFFLNLFNLIPMLPLDGGRAMSAVSVWMWIPGMVILLGFAFISRNAFLPLFAILGALEGWRRFRSPKKTNYHAVRTGTRWLVAAIYLGLCAALAIGMWQTKVATDGLHLARPTTGRWAQLAPTNQRLTRAINVVRRDCTQSTIASAEGDAISFDRQSEGFIGQADPSQMRIVLTDWMTYFALQEVANSDRCARDFGQPVALSFAEKQANRLPGDTIAIGASPTTLATSQDTIINR
jgi:Zn-dependent protease